MTCNDGISAKVRETSYQESRRCKTHGNGRLEATEIDVEAKLAGRIGKILVAEGEFVTMGQTLVQMNIDVLKAQRAEAIAQS